MAELTSKEAQNHFGRLIDTAQKEPVVITRHDRPVAVVVSSERYAELEALEDEIWAARARKAAESGFVGPDDSKKLLEDILDAES